MRTIGSTKREARCARFLFIYRSQEDNCLGYETVVRALLKIVSFGELVLIRSIGPVGQVLARLCFLWVLGHLECTVHCSPGHCRTSRVFLNGRFWCFLLGYNTIKRHIPESSYAFLCRLHPRWRNVVWLRLNLFLIRFPETGSVWPGRRAALYQTLFDIQISQPIPRLMGNCLLFLISSFDEQPRLVCPEFLRTASKGCHFDAFM